MFLVIIVHTYQALIDSSCIERNSAVNDQTYLDNDDDINWRARPCKAAAQWVAANKKMFTGQVLIPPMANAAENEIEELIKEERRRAEEEEDYDSDIRDLSMFQFEKLSDLNLFMDFMIKVNLKVSVGLIN